MCIDGYSQLTWHVPSDEEIDFVLQIFREFIEPILDTLNGLLEPGKSKLLGTLQYRTYSK